MFSTLSYPYSQDMADETGIGSIVIETTSLRSIKLVERSISVDHPLLLRESRRLWSGSGARGRKRVRRLDGSGYKVWARRGLLPMSLSRVSCWTACDRACLLSRRMRMHVLKIYITSGCTTDHRNGW